MALVPSPGGPPLLAGWLARHQHPVSFYLHVAGIPMTLCALPLAARRRWRGARRMFSAGYALQFAGHLVEGAPPGELVALRRLRRHVPPGLVAQGSSWCRLPG